MLDVQGDLFTSSGKRDPNVRPIYQKSPRSKPVPLNWDSTTQVRWAIDSNLERARNLAALYTSTIIPQAEAAIASALAAYRVGNVDFMTLLDGRMTLNKYKQELSGLEAEQGKAWAELEMLLGRSLLNLTATAGATNLGGTSDE